MAALFKGPLPQCISSTQTLQQAGRHKTLLLIMIVKLSCVEMYCCQIAYINVKIILCIALIDQ